MRHSGRTGWVVFLLAASFTGRGHAAEPAAPEKPRFREFMGLCGHTIQFKPTLYAPVCRAVRDYHPFEWDVGGDTSFAPRFPSARNGVDWGQVYGDWKAAGYETEVCIMFHNVPANTWIDLPRDARAYGRAFAEAFGPSSRAKLVAAAEIGNEPGHYDDESYRKLFQNMAAGLRGRSEAEGGHVRSPPARAASMPRASSASSGWNPCTTSSISTHTPRWRVIPPGGALIPRTAVSTICAAFRSSSIGGTSTRPARKSASRNLVPAGRRGAA